MHLVLLICLPVCLFVCLSVRVRTVKNIAPKRLHLNRLGSAIWVSKEETTKTDLN